MNPPGSPQGEYRRPPPEGAPANPPPARLADGRRARRSRLGLVLALLATLGLVLVLAGLTAADALAGRDLGLPLHLPLRVLVDGEPVFDGLVLERLPPAHTVVLVIGGLLVGLAALLVVPLALVLLAAGVLALLVVVLGVPLLALAALLALALSPFLLAGWLLLRLLEGPAPAPAGSSIGPDPTRLAPQTR
jgi:hypothetical protein